MFLLRSINDQNQSFAYGMAKVKMDMHLDRSTICRENNLSNYIRKGYAMKNIKKSGLLIILLIFILSITACQKATPTLDPALKITEIAATVQAEITQNAALTPSMTPTMEPTATATLEPPTATLAPEQITPSATIAPTNRPAETVSTDDNAVYVEDTTIPDGTIIKPGETFVKIWKVKNTGTTTWPTAYRLVYLEGLQGANGTLNVHLDHPVKPDLTLEIKVTFTAPTTPGKYTSYWRLYNSDLEPFGEQLSMMFWVGNP
jgi:hypothetical protein